MQLQHKRKCNDTNSSTLLLHSKLTIVPPVMTSFEQCRQPVMTTISTKGYKTTILTMSTSYEDNLCISTKGYKTSILTMSTTSDSKLCISTKGYNTKIVTLSTSNDDRATFIYQQRIQDLHLDNVDNQWWQTLYFDKRIQDLTLNRCWQPMMTSFVNWQKDTRPQSWLCRTWQEVTRHQSWQLDDQSWQALSNVDYLWWQALYFDKRIQGINLNNVDHQWW